MTDKNLTDNTGKSLVVDDESVERIADAVARKTASDRLSLSALLDRTAGKFRRNLKMHHKVLYAFAVFVGLVLVWYGMWGLVMLIPFLKKPIVALVAGTVLLFLTGAFFRELE